MYRAVHNRKTVRTITPPAALVVSAADVRAFLIDVPLDDSAIIELFIRTATESAKQYTRRAIGIETLECQMDGFSEPDGDDRLASMGPGTFTAYVPGILGGAGEFDLPFAPLQSVTSITTFSRANVPTVVDPSLYQADLQSGRVYLNEGEIWPVDLRARAAVQVRYVAGYSIIPADMAQAIIQHAAAMYECRSACEAPKIARDLLAPYRLADGLAAW
jgi:hypothetical protein